MFLEIPVGGIGPKKRRVKTAFNQRDEGHALIHPKQQRERDQYAGAGMYMLTPPNDQLPPKSRHID